VSSIVIDCRYQSRAISDLYRLVLIKLIDFQYRLTTLGVAASATCRVAVVLQLDKIEFSIDKGIILDHNFVPNAGTTLALY